MFFFFYLFINVSCYDRFINWACICEKSKFCLEMSDENIVKDDLEKLAIHNNEEIDLNYKPPPEKSIEELLNTDKEDESLQKYKEKLLGDANSGKIIFGS